MQTSAIVFDLICLAIVVLTAVYFSAKGGVMGLLSMAGTLVVAVLSWFASRTLASPVFDYFFRDRLMTGLEESMINGRLDEPRLALEEFSHQLPSGVRDALLNSMQQVEIGTEGYVELLINDVVKALLLPAITLLLFLIFFALLRPLLTLFLHLIRKKFSFKTLKAPQRVVGSIVGIILGGLYVLVLVNVAAVIAPIMEFSFFQSGALKSSIFFTIFTRWGVLL